MHGVIVCVVRIQKHKLTWTVFTIYIPYEGRALGLTPAAREDYAKSLMNWSLSHESVVYGLAIYPLCCLPESQDLYSVVRKTIEYLRAKALASINSQLTARIVDDTLIQAIVLAIATDDYLGYVDFGEAHLQGLESLIPLRGGFDTIGTSEPSMKNLQQALLTSVSALKLNISTSLRAHASTPLYRPSYPLSRETIDLVRPLRVGFRNLVRLGFLSTETIHLLTSFSAWLGALPADAAYSAQGWRRPIPAGLNNFEKCIVIALICLGDDLTGLGGHIGALMWRKPAQRAEILLWERSLWREPHFADVTLWMATVICCPQRQDIVPHSQWTILQDRIMGVRGDLHTLLDVERTMRCFFFPSFRMIALVSAWLSRLAP